VVGNTAWSRAYADHVTRLQYVTTNHAEILKRNRLNGCRSKQTDRISGSSRLATRQESFAAFTFLRHLGLMISLGFPASSRPKAVRPVELALAAPNSMFVRQTGRQMFSACRSVHLFEGIKICWTGDLLRATKRQVKFALSQRISPLAFCLPQRREDLPTSECHHDLQGQTAP
jgi:hypothetical protein